MCICYPENQIWLHHIQSQKCHKSNSLISALYSSHTVSNIRGKGTGTFAFQCTLNTQTHSTEEMQESPPFSQMETAAHCCTSTDKYTPHNRALFLRQSWNAVSFTAVCWDCHDGTECVKSCLQRFNGPNKCKKYAWEELSCFFFPLVLFFLPQEVKKGVETWLGQMNTRKMSILIKKKKKSELIFQIILK